LYVIELNGKVTECNTHKGHAFYKKGNSSYMEVRFPDGSYVQYSLAGCFLKDFWVTTSKAIAEDLGVAFKHSYSSGRKFSKKLQTEAWLTQ